MSYPGNTSLSPAVKDRVVSTFQHTVALYKQGRGDEVVAGCNLILMMDPTFEPAKRLLEMTRNPGAPIDVDSLLPAAAPAGGAMQQAREAMAARDFERVIHLTTEMLTEDLTNDEARVLSDEAREKLEAAPFVQQFVRKAEQSIAAGNATAAKTDLDKARALDATHPDVVRVAQILSSRDSAPQTFAPSSSFVVDDTSAQASGRAAAPAADFGFTFEEEKAPAPVSFQPEPTPAPVTFDAEPPSAPPSFENFSFDAPSTAKPPAPPPTPKPPAPEPSFADAFGASSTDSGFASFSFDSPTETASTPPPPAPTPAETPGGPAEFDFSTASVATSADDQKKIEQYLADGDRAFAAGDHQQAIDLWSRIFLIDVTNDQASERIERAKATRRDTEMKADALLASAIAAFESHDNDRARSEFAEILRLDPNNVTAQDYMERLTDTVTEGGAAASSQRYIPPSTSDEKIDIGLFDEPLPSETSDTLIPPSPSATAAVKEAAAKKKAAPKGPARKLPLGLIAAVLGAIVLLGGGWFAWTHLRSNDESQPAVSQGAFARATSLAARGKYDEAIAALQEIPSDDPQHDRALVMIADLQAKRSKSAAMIDGRPAGEFYDQQIAAALTAFNGHDYGTAKAAFEQAMRVKPLPPDLKMQYDAASQQMAKLDSAKALFNERKYADAIANLQPLLQQDPQNASVQRMIVDAHFNLGAMALQEERIPDAMREFDEVLKVNPNDELARRSRDLAGRYDGQPKDLLYRIYVKYLPLRQPA